MRHRLYGWPRPPDLNRESLSRASSCPSAEAASGSPTPRSRRRNPAIAPRFVTPLHAFPRSGGCGGVIGSPPQEGPCGHGAWVWCWWRSCSSRELAAGRGAERPFRTRAANDTSWRLIEDGLARSATVRRLVQRLEQSDVIVIVEVCQVMRPALGDTRILAATAVVRHVRIRITSAAGRVDQLSILGHELQHAVEIASEPGVRDSAGQEDLGRRIGWMHDTGPGYETQAAQEAGDAVRSEIRLARTS